VIMKNVVSAYIERWNFVLGAIFVAIVVFNARRAGAGRTPALALGAGVGATRAS